jgi:hypothetical protein
LTRDTAYLDAAADRAMIHDLLGRYAWALDHGPAEAWADAFTIDAVFEAPNLGFRVAGREALTAFARGVHRTMPNAHHVMTNIMIDLSGDKATGRCALNVFVALSDGVYPALQGWYEDDYVFDSVRWRIRHRRAFVVEPQVMTLGKMGEYFQPFSAAVVQFQI